jgi:hypothetical protein
MIDEIIDTDPDESLHHPIVDANDYQDGKLESFDHGNSKDKSAFNGYDSSFFGRNVAS